MTAFLSGLIRALLAELLTFFGQRLDRNKQDAALRETGAREMEARKHEHFREQARQAMELRGRAPGGDGELDDFLRAPADRNHKRAD
jgi:hypothetical protein